MLFVDCGKNLKEEIRSRMLDILGGIGVTDWRMKEADEGWKIEKGTPLYYGSPEYHDGKLVLVENGLEPAELMASVKEGHPEIVIKGSLLFGDDGHREFFWFESEAGESGVTVDRAVDCDELSLEDAVGYPLSRCAYSYRSSGGFWAIKDYGDFAKAAEILADFKTYIKGRNDLKLPDLWDEYVEDKDGYEEDWYDLFGARGVSLPMSSRFVNDLLKKFKEVPAPESGTKANDAERVIGWFNDGMDVGDIAELTGLSEDEINAILDSE